jgi:membrane protein DedA with SNARE-associated domain
MTHSIFDLMRAAVLHYGYWAVGGFLLVENIGVPVPGETILLLASFLAYSEHELKLEWIIVIATIVTSLGGSLGFALGHHGGRPLLDRYLATFRIRQAALERGENLFARFGALTIFFARFVFGLRLIAGPLAGVLRMPWRKFLIWNFLGATAWVSVICSAGYLFGRHWGRLQRDISRLDAVFLVAALVCGGLWWWRSRVRNRQASAK